MLTRATTSLTMSISTTTTTTPGHGSTVVVVVVVVVVVAWIAITIVGRSRACRLGRFIDWFRCCGCR